MGNKNYINGRAKEYRIMKKLREEGYEIVARSAGSHSPIDVWAIKASKGGYFYGAYGYTVTYDGQIKLIQSKGGKSGKRERKKVLDSDIKRFEGLYWVSVEVL